MIESVLTLASDIVELATSSRNGRASVVAPSGDNLLADGHRISMR